MWYLTAILPLAIEVALIVHLIRTGRDRIWFFIIIFIPLAGSIAYVIIELLPDLIRSHGAARVSAGISNVVDPDKKLRERQAMLALAPTVANRMALAEVWMEKGQPAKAVDLYSECLNGLYKNDTAIMASLGRALHAAGYNVRARLIYEELVRIHGALAEDRDLLCFASVLDSCGETAEAEKAYRIAVAKSRGLEARSRYVAFLKGVRRVEEAARELESMEQEFSLMPRFARREQSKWIEAARKEFT